MNLTNLDWSLILGFFAITLIIGIAVSKRAGQNSSEFFLSGRSMPWWLLGVSMVATTFSADTPNLVTDIVRKNGVAGNWVWWAFLLTGMLTVFVYAKLWRRSGVMTDLEFYELRYSGKGAAFLRGFRALYLGVFFNILIMASVILAGIKIGGVLLGLEPWIIVLVTSIITVAYSAMGGLRGVIITDFFQFLIAMVGTVWAAIVILDLPEVGGLTSLLAHENVVDRLNFLPDFNDIDVLIPLLILPLAVQWWSVWYPGAEPGGGGYIAQRMLSAKDEKNAVGATLMFNVVHYALRPWPWILIALASLIYFPLTIENPTRVNIKVSPNAIDTLNKYVQATDIDFLLEGINFKRENAEKEKEKEEYNRLENIITNNREELEIKSLAFIFATRNTEENNRKDQNEWTDPLAEETLVHLQLAHPNLPVDKLGNDLGYPAMLPYLPSGLLGLVIASLIAALMSTISTHLNWGSSYVVHDFYRRFVKKEASEKELVNIGRVSTIVLMIFASLFALALSNALQAFNILLQIGAGTGLLFILRWFWWRINAYSEISAMVISFTMALYFEFLHPEELADHVKLISGVVITTIGWVTVTFMTQPDDYNVLMRFYKLIRPHSAGWQKIVNQGIANNEITASEVTVGKLPSELLGMFAGVFFVYGALFGMGFFIYGNITNGLMAMVVVAISGSVLWKVLKK